MTKGTVIIDQDRCKGCQLCVAVCPQEVLAIDAEHINRSGYHPAILLENGQCTGCSLCAVVCPDVCFTVYREDSKRTQRRLASV